MPGGRPRALDVDESMPTIVRLFWKEGFGRMTLDQVASALSVTKPTLFRTLGDKEGIFAKALQAYYQTHIRPGEERLEAATTLREGVEGCFAFSVARILDPNNPHGCFLTDTTLSGEFTTGPIAETIETLQDHTLQLLRRRAHEAIDSGELRPTTDPDAVVRYLLAQFAALSAVSRLDADRESLDAIVGFMVDGLPWAT